jgi:hypothetical protein
MYLYFPNYYTQFLYFAYLLYYFARKAIRLEMQNSCLMIDDCNSN